MAGGGAQGANLAQIAQQLQGAGQPGGSQFTPTQSPMSNYASPNFMQYEGQGQPNQPQNTQFSPMTAAPAPTQVTGGPDVTGSSPASNMGFDGSGSDAGIGGQPVNQMQSPVQWQGNKPPSMSQLRPQQGFQIQGNPTSQVVQKPQK